MRGRKLDDPDETVIGQDCYAHGYKLKGMGGAKVPGGWGVIKSFYRRPRGRKVWVWVHLLKSGRRLYPLENVTVRSRPTPKSRRRRR